MMDPTERQKYLEIFQGQNPVNGYISGNQARSLFLNSGLQVSQLERIWDLSDIDKDGQLDFDEFCIAMRLVYNALNGVEIPAVLPHNLIPSSKMSFLGYNTYSQQQQPKLDLNPPLPSTMSTGYGYGGAQPEFNWTMSPQDTLTYENIYHKYAGGANYIRFNQLEEFYRSLPIPRPDISAAWSLVDVNHTQQISKEQCLAFLHLLNSRTRGQPLPTTLPQSLRQRFMGPYASNQNSERSTLTSRMIGSTSATPSKNAALADSYITKLGVAGSSISRTGTSFPSRKSAYTEEDEESLRKELDDLRRRVHELQSSHTSSSSSTLKEEFRALYDYKLSQLAQSDSTGGGTEKLRDAVAQLEEAAQTLERRKDELVRILDERRRELENVKSELALVK
ncbi:uncharacterized protein VTP21DRAFT_5586 [Calcarisporiella thermophila]|uniref:uncharacterized protein n=1 Tax=Calcarisporiella thermophila TaxID=911321 RepID=UPI0037427119